MWVFFLFCNLQAVKIVDAVESGIVYMLEDVIDYGG